MVNSVPLNPYDGDLQEMQTENRLNTSVSLGARNSSHV